MNDDFERLMDAHQTLIQLKVGDVLTQDMIDDLMLVDSDYREDSERATDAFHRGYQAGLMRGSNADTVKLIEERDEARMEALALRALYANPPKHRFWGAGEADCPREIKAGNGELHTLRCKVCGQDSPRNEICPGATQ